MGEARTRTCGLLPGCWRRRGTLLLPEPPCWPRPAWGLATAVLRAGPPGVSPSCVSADGDCRAGDEWDWEDAASRRIPKTNRSKQRHAS